MSMTPKFNIGDRVITYDNITGEITGIHIDTFADATRNTVMYSLRNLTRPKIGQTPILPSVLRDERDLSLVPEPVVYEYKVLVTAKEATKTPMTQNEADSLAVVLARALNQGRVYRYAVSQATPVRTAQQVEGEYWADCCGSGCVVCNWSGHNVDFGKPAPVKTAQQVEGEYWAEYHGKGTE